MCPDDVQSILLGLDRARSKQTRNSPDTWDEAWQRYQWWKQDHSRPSHGGWGGREQNPSSLDPFFGVGVGSGFGRLWAEGPSRRGSGPWERPGGHPQGRVEDTDRVVWWGEISWVGQMCWKGLQVKCTGAQWSSKKRLKYTRNQIKR